MSYMLSLVLSLIFFPDYFRINVNTRAHVYDLYKDELNDIIYG